MNDDEDRIRQKAYALWVEQGRPDGRAEENWEKAKELVAIEDNQSSTLKPRKSGAKKPVEPLEAVENAGEFPDLRDQGDNRAGPRKRSSKR
jgi:hypothetical protein